MAFYVFRPIERQWLALDERSWDPSFFEAAAFTDRALAEQIAEREQAHDAMIFDDGAAQ